MSYCRCRFAEADADVPTTPSPAWRASPRAVGGPTGGAAHACDARVRCMMAAVSGQASSNLTGKLASEVAAVAGRGGQEVTPHWGSLHGRGRIGKLQIALFGVLSAESAYRPRAAARSGRFGLFCPKSAHFLAQMSTCDTPSPTVRQYFWNFLGALAHGGRHVALEPLCCGEDKHSTPVLSGALLPYPSTTAPAHPPYLSLRIDPAQPHLNSRPQP